MLGDLVRMPLPQDYDPTIDPLTVAQSAAQAGTSSVQGAIVLQQTPAGVLMTVFGPTGPGPTVNVGNNAMLAAANAARDMCLKLGPWYKQRGQFAAPLYPGGESPYGAGGSYRQNGYDRDSTCQAGGVYGANSPWGTPGNPYAPTPILPDAILPRALRRGQPLGALYPSDPNQHDKAIAGEAALWLWIAQHGGLKGCCRIPELGFPVWNSPNWKEMQSQDEQFNPMFALPVSQISGGGPFDGTDTVIGSVLVPKGYDGVINRFVCGVSAQTAGFNDFSGDVVWRLKINARYARNLGNVINSYGSFSTAFQVPGGDIIRLVSGQTIQLIAAIPTGSPVAGGTIQAGVFGWFTPRR